jgi:hypothetical protein
MDTLMPLHQEKTYMILWNGITISKKFILKNELRTEFEVTFNANQI